MEILDRSRSVVVVVDLQSKLIAIAHRPRLLIESSVKLLKLAGLFGVPVILTEQYPKGLGPTHPEVKAAYDALTVPKLTLAKTTFGCCADPAFGLAMDEVCPRTSHRQRQVVFAGVETHVCVMQTVLELLQLGNQVHVAWDCVSGRGEENRRHALDRMAAAGAVITNHESVGFEWARDKNHPSFREMSRLFTEPPGTA